MTLFMTTIGHIRNDELDLEVTVAATADEVTLVTDPTTESPEFYSLTPADARRAAGLILKAANEAEALAYEDD